MPKAIIQKIIKEEVEFQNCHDCPFFEEEVNDFSGDSIYFCKKHYFDSKIVFHIPKEIPVNCEFNEINKLERFCNNELGLPTAGYNILINELKHEGYEKIIDKTCRYIILQVIDEFHLSTILEYNESFIEKYKIHYWLDKESKIFVREPIEKIFHFLEEIGKSHKTCPFNSYFKVVPRNLEGDLPMLFDEVIS